MNKYVKPMLANSVIESDDFIAALASAGDNETSWDPGWDK